MQSSTASAKNNANQHPWQTDDDHYAFMEGLMGEDYAKELQTSNKNTAQNKQEKYSNMANNKNNSAGSTNNAADTATKKTVRGEGLHYLPNGGTDSKGNSLPAGSYIRVQNGVEYVVLPGDPRIPERIEAEYQKQKNTQPQAAATPIQSDTVQKTETQVDSQQVPSPEAETEEDFWENVFEQPQEEKAYIELPNNIFGEDEIDTSDYDSFVDYIEENGLYYDFYAGYNEQGEKVRFAELYDRETGERLATLQEGKDFFYAKDGVFFTKDFTYNSRGRKILEMRAGIYVGDDARELFESLGYEISISGDTIYITDETGKTHSFARGEEFSATKNGIFIAPGALNSKTIQDLIKNNPKSRIKDQVIDYAERILRADGDITQEDLDYLAENIGLLEGDTEVEAALGELFNDEEFAAAWEERTKRLEEIEKPQTEKDETTAGEMIFAAVAQIFLGITYETGNKAFDTSLKMVSFAMLLTPAGIGRKLLGKAASSFALKGVLKLAQRLLQNQKVFDKAKQAIIDIAKKRDVLAEIKGVFDDAYTGFFGYCNLLGVEVPLELKQLIEQVIDELGEE